MPAPDPQTAAYGLILIITVIGVVGMLVVLLLAAAWRRHDQRYRRLEERHRRPDAAVDPWKAAADRVDAPEDGGDGRE